MRPLDLQKIKAKDVFVAQAVLSEDRHRKLVSIAQGFAGIRARLDALTQNLSDGEQVSACAKKAEIDLGLVSASRTEATVSPTVVQDMASGDQSIEIGITVEQPFTPDVMPEKQGSKSVCQAFSRTDRPQEYAPTPGLLEMMRPFIVMVCEEFDKALVKVISIQCMNVALPDALDQAQSLIVARSAGALSGPVVEEMQIDRNFDKISYEDRHTDETETGRVDTYFASKEEGEENALDVQPLFDPKLPPSADSDFKPKIGLVGTSGSDFEGLRQRYPQLHLTIVQAEALSDVRRLGHCQRIIALHEEIAPGTDALLSRELRHRYIRLDGGMDGIEAQLDAWLAAPGSIAAGSRRRMPFGGAKGNAASKMKRQSRYPKWAGNAG